MRLFHHHFFLSPLSLVLTNLQALLPRALCLYPSLCGGEVAGQHTFWGHRSPVFGGRGHSLLILMSNICPIEWIRIPNPELGSVWCWSEKLVRYHMKNVVHILNTLDHRRVGWGTRSYLIYSVYKCTDCGFLLIFLLKWLLEMNSQTHSCWIIITTFLL